MSVDSEVSTPDSFVLKKVASLTLSTLETKIVKPKFVPEKINFKLYEVFEGKFSCLEYSACELFNFTKNSRLQTVYIILSKTDSIQHKSITIYNSHFTLHNSQ